MSVFEVAFMNIPNKGLKKDGEDLRANQEARSTLATHEG